jgi:hypothetical protein
MKNKNLGWYRYFILLADAIYLWYVGWFFTTASTMINIIGIVSLVTLVVLTIKLFKKQK